ncbi:hypothetical protein [Synechococcus elongatus]|uniref:hypothetical protein n=1 Tax=Synechococcus elongatus TaxID=32046 RepID=UPI0030D1792B
MALFSRLAPLAGVLCLGWPSLAIAQTAPRCVPLKAVGSEGSVVSKRVSPNTVLFVRDNWNTDFFVPPDSRYSQFLVSLTSKTVGSGTRDSAGQELYTIRAYLKYDDSNTDKLFDQSIELPQGIPFDIQLFSRPYESPYQVNVVVGGERAIGSDYSLTVFGCN